jgi:DNA-directed RNA polymerase subunit beta
MTPVVLFINGAERVLFLSYIDLQGFLWTVFSCNGTKLYSRVIPFKGSWIEFSTDINSVMYAYIDRKKNYLLLLYSVQLDSKETRISLRF